MTDKEKLMQILDKPVFPDGKDCLEAVTDYLLKNDVVPVTHAHWWLEREPDGNPYCFHCSNCDSDGHHIGIKTASDYCPNCGAKMDGDTHE